MKNYVALVRDRQTGEYVAMDAKVELPSMVGKPFTRNWYKEELEGNGYDVISIYTEVL